MGKMCKNGNKNSISLPNSLSSFSSFLAFPSLLFLLRERSLSRVRRGRHLRVLSPALAHVRVRARSLASCDTARGRRFHGRSFVTRYSPFTTNLLTPRFERKPQKPHVVSFVYSQTNETSMKLFISPHFFRPIFLDLGFNRS